MRGHVKWFNNLKGYGFIKIDEERDAIVHYSAIENPKEGYKYLVEDEEVEFDLISTVKGLRAENVTRLKYINNE